MVVVNKNRKSKLLDSSMRSANQNGAMKKNVKIGANKPLFTQISHSRTPKSFTYKSQHSNLIGSNDTSKNDS